MSSKRALAQCPQVAPERFFWKSDYKQLIMTGKVKRNLKKGEAVNLNGKEFVAGEIQIKRREVIEAKQWQEVGICLLKNTEKGLVGVKPKDLKKIGIKLS